MMEEESSERMFRIILLSNQKKNKSVSCFSCLQTYYTRSVEQGIVCEMGGGMFRRNKAERPPPPPRGHTTTPPRDIVQCS